MLKTPALIEQIIENVLDIIYIYDLETQHHVYINQQATHILGYTLEQLDEMGSHLLEKLIHPDDFDDMLDRMGEYFFLKDGEYAERSYRWKHINGSWRFLHSRTKVFARDEQGKPRQLLGIAQDITKRQDVEKDFVKTAQLELQLKQEHELNLIKSAIMQRISHEFRTPLTIIMSSSELIERYNERLIPEKRQQQFQRIRQQVRHLTHVLDDILQVVNSSLNHHEFYPNTCNLAIFCKDCIGYVLRHYPQYQIDLTIEDDKKLIRIDTHLAEQILESILLNAIKYSSQEKIIRVQVKIIKDVVIFEVVDEGLGIPEKDKSRLFEPFFRGSNLNEIGGLGLGLTIVKHAVDLHYGTIEIISQENQGTTVTVILPYT